MEALRSSLILRPPQCTAAKPCSAAATRFSPISASSQSATVSAPKRERDPKKRIVVTGMGLVSVFGNDVSTFYDKLLEGESGVDGIDGLDPAQFTTQFAAHIRGFSSEGYIDGKTDRRVDNYVRYGTVAGKKAAKNANITGDSLRKIDKTQAGVIVGTGRAGTSFLISAVESIILKDGCKMNPFSTPYGLTNSPAAMLAIAMGFMGPTYAISTGCATSNCCFLAAANHIRQGKASLMIVGGIESPILPVALGGFAACRLLSKRNNSPKTAARPWDKDRDGFVIGEGAGVLVLESLEHAMKRDAPIIAEYLGGAINCDAHHLTDPKENGLVASLCIKECLRNSGVSLEEVNYINAHATSSPIGDMAEVNAIKHAFRNTSRIKVNSTKSMIGHCFGAAGALEAIATIKAITTGWLHPTINQFNVEPCVEFDTIANKKLQHEVNVAISNSFGLGGQNSVVAFCPFKP